MVAMFYIKGRWAPIQTHSDCFFLLPYHFYSAEQRLQPACDYLTVTVQEEQHRAPGFVGSSDTGTDEAFSGVLANHLHFGNACKQTAV